MTLLLALTIAALVLLPGLAFIAGRLAFTTWRQQRRRNARGAWRMIADVRGLRSALRPLAGRDSY